MNRRHFLQNLGYLGLASAAGPLAFRAFGTPASAAALAGFGDTVLPAGTPILVQIILDGGNDDLNTLVPVTNSWYYDAEFGHGPLALAAEDTLALNGLSQYRLHPALDWLAQRWNTQQDVAFIQGVGEFDRISFSHFDSMKVWQTTDSNLVTPTGWIGRFNDLVAPGNPYASVSLNQLRLECVAANTPTLVLQTTDGFFMRLPGYPLGEADTTLFREQLLAMAAGQPEGLPRQAGELIGRTFDMSERIVAATDAPVTAGVHSRIAEHLLQTALMIRAGIPSQTYSMAYGPFDTHGGQLEMQGQLLTQLNEGLGKFFAALAGSGRQQDVVVQIVSEFGRQITANGSAGTDHGQGGMSILIGNAVNGGLHGEAPTLDPGGPTRPNRIHDAQVPNTDFRRLFAATVNHLAGDSGAADVVLGTGFGAPLEVFRSATAVFSSGFE
jgi:uncharacterized protein (DUF1501 family)